MSQPSSKYIAAVLEKLIALPMKAKFGSGKKTAVLDVSEVMVIPPDTNHPNWPKTIAAMQHIIDWKEDLKHGFSITFNTAYTKFKKSIYVIK